jgi:dTDP-L-rhamnose 4-epimerase
MPNILVTGGAGFIGQHLIHALLSTDCSVICLDSFEAQIHGEKPHYTFDVTLPNLQVIKGDVCDRKTWLSFLDGIESIVHLAAQTGTGQSMYQVARYTEDNVGGTAMMWDILANEEHRVKKVIVASSRAIYGEGAYWCSKCCDTVVPEPRSKDRLSQRDWFLSCPICGSPTEPMATQEQTYPQPASLYACTKLAQEQMCLTMGAALGISTIALRFQNVYGPGQSLQNPYTGIISIFSNQMRQDLPINIYEDGQETRDFIYVGDVVDICLRSLYYDCKTLLLNVGSGEATAVIDLAEQLKRLWKSESLIKITGDFRVGDIRHNWADLSRLVRLFPDWTPTSLTDGLERFVNWAQTQAIYEDRSHLATQELKKRNL